MSARSHWGWGEAARFPKVEGRRTLGGMLQAVLDLPVQEPDEPVPLAAIELPQARLGPPEGLTDIASHEAEDRIRHTYGRSYPDILRGYRGDFALAPDLVLRPRAFCQ